MSDAPGSTAVCAFCGTSTNISPTGDGVEIVISRRGEEGTQEVFAHMSCLGERLHPTVPYLFDRPGGDGIQLPPEPPPAVAARAAA